MPTTNADIDSFGDRGPLLRWLVFTGLCIFAFILLWRFGLIRQMVASDRTYISSIIGLLYVAASLHCLWRTIAISREGDAARRGGCRREPCGRLRWNRKAPHSFARRRRRLPPGSELARLARRGASGPSRPWANIVL